jgi:outer membrane protein assembly factor BamB
MTRVRCKTPRVKPNHINFRRLWAPGLNLLFGASTLSIAASTPNTNWPQFRGPQASGITEGFSTLTTWNLATGENVQWQTDIPGLAHSSPIVWGDRVFVTTAVQPGKAELKVGLYGDIASVDEKEPEQWRIMALDKATGHVLWDTLGFAGIPHVKRHPKSSHCSSTPATDGQRIAAIFGSEGLFCFDVAGKLLWKKDLGPMEAGFYMVPAAQWGFASSPVIQDGKVIVQCDVLTNSFLAAFSLDDGRELWRTPRRDVPTWSTPTVAVSPGRQQIIVNGWHHIGGYDLTSGKELWKLDGGGDIPVPTPIVANGFVYLTSAHGQARPMRAVRLDATGDITPPNINSTNAAIAWVHARQGNYMQTPIVVGDFLYACFDAGILTCFDARSGQIRYSERLASGSQGFTASPVAADGKIYVTSEIGNVFVIPASGTFSILATNSMQETCMATPAISAGTLLFRTRSKLVAVHKQ